MTDRVRDPIEDKKKAITARIARTRDELDDFNDKSTKHRQDWATSQNQILRMAGNALREIVVCAEEDLCMLEDELGRLDGILAPKDTDGPMGRVTSGQYGSEIAVGQTKNKDKYGVLAAATQRVPSTPRSPTVPIQLQSASKLGVQGEGSSGRGGDSSGSEGVGEVLTKTMAGDRIKDFLLGPAGAMHIQPLDTTEKTDVLGTKNIFLKKKLSYTSKYNITYPDPVLKAALSDGPPTIVKKADDTNSPSPSTFEKNFPQKGSGMGLVEWQSRNGIQMLNIPDQNQHLSTGGKPKNDISWGVGQPIRMPSNTANDSVDTLGDPLPSNVQKRVDQILLKEEQKSSNATTTAAIASRWSEPFTTKAPFGWPLLSNPVEHLNSNNNKKKNNVPTDTTSGDLSNIHTAGNFGFHISQPADRVIAPPGGLATAFQERSAGIKDFQVRVWSAAKAAKAGDSQPQEQGQIQQGGQGNMTNPSTAATTTTSAAAAAAVTTGTVGGDGVNTTSSGGEDEGGDVRVFRRTRTGTAFKVVDNGECIVKAPEPTPSDDPFV